MKQFRLFLWGLISLFVCGFTYAEESTPPTIKMKTTREVDEVLDLEIIAEGEFTIEGAKSTDTEDEYILTAEDGVITIYGKIIDLSCLDGGLVELDVTHAPELVNLYCSYNQLQKIDLSRNPKLAILWIANNQLQELNLSWNPELAQLWCSNNRLTKLDLSKNGQLQTLTCGKNPLGNLELKQNPLLVGIDCNTCQISALDLSANNQLQELFCYNNFLTQLDLLHNPQLIRLNCSHNQLQEIDLSKNTSLQEISCDRNQIHGEKMSALIISLVDRSSVQQGQWVVVADNPAEKNSCTKEQVEAARKKNWKVLKISESTKDISDYEGTTGVNQADKSSVQIYPNPTSEAITAEGLPHPALAVLYAADGTIVATQAVSPEGTLRISVQHLPEGSYLLSIGQEISQPLLIQR